MNWLSWSFVCWRNMECFTFNCRFESVYRGRSEFTTFSLIFFYLYINTTTVLNLRSLEIYVSNSKLLSNFTEIIVVTLVSSSPFGKSSQVLVFLYPASVRLAFNTSTCGCTCQVKCECHCYWKRGLIDAIRFLNYRWETIDWSFNKTITAIKKMSLSVKCHC